MNWWHGEKCIKGGKQSCESLAAKSVVYPKDLIEKSLELKMRYSLCLAALAATVLALPTPDVEDQEEVFTIELEGGERRQVTEAEKFALKAVSAHVKLTRIAVKLIIIYRAIQISST
jgi:hypothetical protein